MTTSIPITFPKTQTLSSNTKTNNVDLTILQGLPSMSTSRYLPLHPNSFTAFLLTQLKPSDQEKFLSLYAAIHSHIGINIENFMERLSWSLHHVISPGNAKTGPNDISQTFSDVSLRYPPSRIDLCNPSVGSIYPISANHSSVYLTPASRNYLRGFGSKFSHEAYFVLLLSELLSRCGYNALPLNYIPLTSLCGCFTCPRIMDGENPGGGSTSHHIYQQLNPFQPVYKLVPMPSDIKFTLSVFFPLYALQRQNGILQNQYHSFYQNIINLYRKKQQQKHPFNYFTATFLSTNQQHQQQQHQQQERNYTNLHQFQPLSNQNNITSSSTTQPTHQLPPHLSRTASTKPLLSSHPQYNSPTANLTPISALQLIPPNFTTNTMFIDSTLCWVRGISHHSIKSRFLFEKIFFIVFLFMATVLAPLPEFICHLMLPALRYHTPKQKSVRSFVQRLQKSVNNRVNGFFTTLPLTAKFFNHIFNLITGSKIAQLFFFHIINLSLPEIISIQDVLHTGGGPTGTEDNIKADTLYEESSMVDMIIQSFYLATPIPSVDYFGSVFSSEPISTKSTTKHNPKSTKNPLDNKKTPRSATNHPTSASLSKKKKKLLIPRPSFISVVYNWCFYVFNWVSVKTKWLFHEHEYRFQVAQDVIFLSRIERCVSHNTTSTMDTVSSWIEWFDWLLHNKTHEKEKDGKSDDKKLSKKDQVTIESNSSTTTTTTTTTTTNTSTLNSTSTPSRDHPCSQFELSYFANVPLSHLHSIIPHSKTFTPPSHDVSVILGIIALIFILMAIRGEFSTLLYTVYDTVQYNFSLCIYTLLAVMKTWVQYLVYLCTVYRIVIIELFSTGECLYPIGMGVSGNSASFDINGMQHQLAELFVLNNIISTKGWSPLYQLIFSNALSSAIDNGNNVSNTMGFIHIAQTTTQIVPSGSNFTNNQQNSFNSDFFNINNGLSTPSEAPSYNNNNNGYYNSPMYKTGSYHISGSQPHHQNEQNDSNAFIHDTYHRLYFNKTANQGQDYNINYHHPSKEDLTAMSKLQIHQLSWTRLFTFQSPLTRIPSLLQQVPLYTRYITNVMLTTLSVLISSYKHPRFVVFDYFDYYYNHDKYNSKQNTLTIQNLQHEQFQRQLHHWTLWDQRKQQRAREEEGFFSSGGEQIAADPIKFESNEVMNDNESIPGSSPVFHDNLPSVSEYNNEYYLLNPQNNLFTPWLWIQKQLLHYLMVWTLGSVVFVHHVIAYLIFPIFIVPVWLVSYLVSSFAILFVEHIYMLFPNLFIDLLRIFVSTLLGLFSLILTSCVYLLSTIIIQIPALLHIQQLTTVSTFTPLRHQPSQFFQPNYPSMYNQTGMNPTRFNNPRVFATATTTTMPNPAAMPFSPTNDEYFQYYQNFDQFAPHGGYPHYNPQGTHFTGSISPQSAQSLSSGHTSPSSPNSQPQVSSSAGSPQPHQSPSPQQPPTSFPPSSSSFFIPNPLDLFQFPHSKLTVGASDWLVVSLQYIIMSLFYFIFSIISILWSSLLFFYKNTLYLLIQTFSMWILFILNLFLVGFVTLRSLHYRALHTPITAFLPRGPDAFDMNTKHKDTLHIDPIQFGLAGNLKGSSRWYNFFNTGGNSDSNICSYHNGHNNTGSIYTSVLYNQHVLELLKQQLVQQEQVHTMLGLCSFALNNDAKANYDNRSQLRQIELHQLYLSQQYQLQQYLLQNGIMPTWGNSTVAGMVNDAYNTELDGGLARNNSNIQILGQVPNNASLPSTKEDVPISGLLSPTGVDHTPGFETPFPHEYNYLPYGTPTIPTFPTLPALPTTSSLPSLPTARSVSDFNLHNVPGGTGVNQFEQSYIYNPLSGEFIFPPTDEDDILHVNSAEIDLSHLSHPAQHYTLVPGRNQFSINQYRHSTISLVNAYFETIHKEAILMCVNKKMGHDGVTGSQNRGNNSIDSNENNNDQTRQSYEGTDIEALIYQNNDSIPTFLRLSPLGPFFGHQNSLKTFVDPTQFLDFKQWAHIKTYTEHIDVYLSLSTLVFLQLITIDFLPELEQLQSLVTAYDDNYTHARDNLPQLRELKQFQQTVLPNQSDPINLHGINLYSDGTHSSGAQTSQNGDTHGHGSDGNSFIKLEKPLSYVSPPNSLYKHEIIPENDEIDENNAISASPIPTSFTDGDNLGPSRYGSVTLTRLSKNSSQHKPVALTPQLPMHDFNHLPSVAEPRHSEVNILYNNAQVPNSELPLADLHITTPLDNNLRTTPIPFSASQNEEFSLPNLQHNNTLPSSPTENSFVTSAFGMNPSNARANMMVLSPVGYTNGLERATTHFNTARQLPFSNEETDTTHLSSPPIKRVAAIAASTIVQQQMVLQNVLDLFYYKVYKLQLHHLTRLKQLSLNIPITVREVLKIFYSKQPTLNIASLLESAGMGVIHQPCDPSSPIQASGALDNQLKDPTRPPEYTIPSAIPSTLLQRTNSIEPFALPTSPTCVNATLVALPGQIQFPTLARFNSNVIPGLSQKTHLLGGDNQDSNSNMGNTNPHNGHTGGSNGGKELGRNGENIDGLQTFATVVSSNGSSSEPDEDGDDNGVVVVVSGGKKKSKNKILGSQTSAQYTAPKLSPVPPQFSALSPISPNLPGLPMSSVSPSSPQLSQTSTQFPTTEKDSNDTIQFIDLTQVYNETSQIQYHANDFVSLAALPLQTQLMVLNNNWSNIVYASASGTAPSQSIRLSVLAGRDTLPLPPQLIPQTQSEGLGLVNNRMSVMRPNQGFPQHTQTYPS